MERIKMIELIKACSFWVASSWLRIACIALILALIVETIIRRLIKYREFRNKINKLPGPQVVNPILGNIPASVLNLIFNNKRNTADDFYTSQIQSVLGHTFIYQDEPLFRLWIGQEPVVCVWKPESVERVLNDSFLLEKSYHYDFLRPWLGNGLLTSPSKIWRPRRKLLVPSFHFNILQAFVPVFDRKSKLMVRNIKRKLFESIDNQQRNNKTTFEDDKLSIVVDVTPIITACTLDAICETIMGVSINAQENPNNDYCQSIYIVGETFLERIIQPKYWLDWLFRLTELGKLYRYHLNKLHSFTRRVIAEKKKDKLGSSCNIGCSSEFQSDPESSNGATILLETRLRTLKKSTVDSYQEKRIDGPKLPKAFLDLLLDRVNLSANSEGQKLTDEEIREEVDTFMFEGHDTTAMALSWTIFLLGHNKSVQEKLWNEVDQFYENELVGGGENDEIELDHLKKMKYLDCVIKEALRLCPSVPFIGRKTTNELKLGDYTVPPGSVVFVLIYQLHRNSETFPNPEKFNPDRFLPENSLGRHPFAYVPFSAGPRNCIGQKFALAEMKTILLHLTKNFQFESITPIDRAKVQMEMVLRPKCPLEIRIKPRGNLTLEQNS